MRLPGLHGLLLILFVMILGISGCGYKDLTAFQQDDLWGYKDDNGHVVIKPQYILAEEFSRYGIAAVADPKKGYIYINQDGEFVIKPYPIRNDNYYDQFSEGLARFEKSGKMGFFNRHGAVVIPARFEYVGSFQNGFAPVGIHITKTMNGELELITAEKWGFINKRGDLVIPFRFTEIIQSFDDHGIAEVVEDGKTLRIDGEGNVIKTQLK